jgi:hypothetical protein
LAIRLTSVPSTAHNRVPCNKGCGGFVHFDQHKRSVTGRVIPLGDDGEPHQCTTLQQQQQQQPTQQQQPNPIARMARRPSYWDSEEGLKAISDKKQSIKDAQDERREQHRELIHWLKINTAAIIYQTSCDHEQDVKAIEEAIGYADYTNSNDNDASPQ